jgi:hypothetical protein
VFVPLALETTPGRVTLSQSSHTVLVVLFASSLDLAESANLRIVCVRLPPMVSDSLIQALDQFLGSNVQLQSRNHTPPFAVDDDAIVRRRKASGCVIALHRRDGAATPS